MKTTTKKPVLTVEELDQQWQVLWDRLRAARAAYWERKVGAFDLAQLERECEAVAKKRNKAHAKAFLANAPLDTFEARQSTGRCGQGESDHGQLYHAVSDERALCGRTPGQMTAGWGWERLSREAVTCPKCLAGLAKKVDAN